MNKSQIKIEFQKRLDTDNELYEKLEKAVNLFRRHWKSDVPTSTEKFQTDTLTAFFKISELVTRTYATKEEWDTKENIFIKSYSRESTANLRPMSESLIIDEIKQNTQIGYEVIVKNKSDSEKEINDLYGIVKRYYSQFWR